MEGHEGQAREKFWPRICPGIPFKISKEFIWFPRTRSLDLMNSSPWLSHSPLKSHFNLKANSSTASHTFHPTSPKHPHTENDTVMQPVAQARNWMWTNSTSPSIYVPKEPPHSAPTTSPTHQLPPLSLPSPFSGCHPPSFGEQWSFHGSPCLQNCLLWLHAPSWSQSDWRETTGLKTDLILSISYCKPFPDSPLALG